MCFAYTPKVGDFWRGLDRPATAEGCFLRFAIDEHSLDVRLHPDKEWLKEEIKDHQEWFEKHPEEKWIKR